MDESPETTPTPNSSPLAPAAEDNSAPPPADQTESPPPPEPEPEPQSPPASPPLPASPPRPASPPPHHSPPSSLPQSPPPAAAPPSKSSPSAPSPSHDNFAPPPPSLPPPSPDSPVRPPPPPKPFAPSTPPSGGLVPPSPIAPSKPSPPHRTPPNPGTPSNKEQSDSTLPLVLGLCIGIGLFAVIMTVALVLCAKRKRKSRNKGGYYNGGQLPKWQNGGQGMEYGGIPPPPPGAWGQAPPPPGMGSGEMSLNNSGPYSTSLSPPSPSVALGFSKSSFSYDELAAATGGFSRENLLGQGGFGYVYKGVLPNGTVVAVKQLKSGSGQGEREFQAEVEIISRVHHRHLVSLVGYCTAGAQRMLVYEFVQNNTLEHHLHGRGLPPMDWPTRLKIAIGSARGLAYLHEDCHPRIIHRDIKTANILLDNNFEAMVADFGLAKFTSDTNTHVSTRIMGTFGYLAPEYASTGKLTEKSDVFSFGVMLLELITGRRPVDNYMEESLVEWTRPLLTQALNDEKYDELADPRLENRYDPAEMARMVASAAACVRHSAKRRPKMSQIVRALDGDVSLDDLNKSGQSTGFSANSDTETYSAKMRQFRKLALDSTEYSNEYSVGTSDGGINPSEASSSGEMSSAGSRRAAVPLYQKL